MRRLLWVGVALVAWLFLMAGEVSSQVKVKFGYLPIIAFAPFYAGVETGLFKRHGLDVELVRFKTGADMSAFLATGQLDAGGGENGASLFNAVATGLELKIVAGLVSQPKGYGATPLLVRKQLIESGEVDSVAKLKGRKGAITVKGGMDEYLLAKALEGAGLTIDDMQVTTMPFPERVAAFATGALDAAVLPEPLASVAKAKGVAVPLIEGDQIVEWPQNGTIYFGKTLLNNRELAVRFMRAYIEACRLVFGDGWKKEEVVKAINKYTEVPPPAIQAARVYYFDPDARMNAASVQRIQEYFLKRGYLRYKELMPVEKYVDDSFRQEALKELPPFQR